MAGLEFSVTASAVACSETVGSKLGFKAPANQCVKFKRASFSLNGTDSTDGPALVEICKCTWANANVPGTNSTPVTPLSTNGRSETIQTTAAKSWSAEPTVLTVLREKYVATYMGLLVEEFDDLLPGGTGIVIRVTLPTGVTSSMAITLDCEE